MLSTWLVINPGSGSFDEALVETIAERFAAAGQPFARTIDVGTDDLPDAQGAGTAQRVVILTGDGTVSALHAGLSGWEGEILVLPGGTMNLLARALHGEAEPLEIVDAVLACNAKPVTIPLITAPGIVALSGLFAGPTTAWGDVREQMRNLDVAGLVETVPRAIAATLGEDSVSAEGAKGAFPAFYLQPSEEGIKLTGVKADGPGDLLAHGWAWISGDFRDGPSDNLGTRAQVTIHGSEPGGTLSLLVDGEKEQTDDPVTFSAAASAIRFLSLNGRCIWP